jgi:TonB family protein
MLAGVSYAGNHLAATEKQGELQKDAQPVYRIEPKYPIKAAKERIEGGVLLKFDIIANGSVDNVEVVNASPAYVFDKTAITALKQWRYKPSGKVQKTSWCSLIIAWIIQPIRALL